MTQKYYILACVSLVIAISCWLEFGDPQSCRLIFIYRAFIRNDSSVDKVLPNYTGEQLLWHANGRKAGVINYVNGVLSGKSKTWYLNGTLRSVEYYNFLPKSEFYIGFMQDNVIYKIRCCLFNRLLGINMLFSGNTTFLSIIIHKRVIWDCQVTNATPLAMPENQAMSQKLLALC